jgi:hypothetical protein
MVLVVARLEAGPVISDQRRSRGELENNPRKPRNLIENRHSDSLKRDQLPLSQGKMKRGDDVAVDEDDDAVTTSVSQGRVTAPL